MLSFIAGWRWQQGVCSGLRVVECLLQFGPIGLEFAQVLVVVLGAVSV